jgi:hypothetical protein
MDPETEGRKELLSRRDFARKAALAAASAAIAPAALRGSRATTGDLAILEGQAPPSTPLSAEDQAQVESRVAAILRKYGDRLSPDQKNEIHRLSVELQKPMTRLRAYPLGNGSQPATVLKVVSEAKPAPGKTRR